MPQRRVLITGWTGHTGSRVLERAARRWPDAAFVGVTRRPDAAPPRGLECRFRTAVAALEDEAAVEAAAFDTAGSAPFDLMLHIAHVRHTPAMMRLAEKYGVPRAVLVHTTGMYSRYREYGARYREIDDAVRARPADSLPVWTILRPTMIYGDARDHNMHRLIAALARWPVFPLLGDRRSLFQPVHVDDVADAVLAVLEEPACRGRAYDLSGGSTATYREILETIAGLLGRRVWLAPVPYPLALAAARLGGSLRPGRGVGVTVEQVRRLRESKAFSHADAARDFGFQPRSLKAGLEAEIRQMAADGLIRAPAATPQITERLPG